MLDKIMVVGQSVTMDTIQDNHMTQVSLVLTYERAILQLQISSIFHMNCFLCIIIIILNSVIGTLYSTNNIIVTLLLCKHIVLNFECGPAAYMYSK